MNFKSGYIALVSVIILSSILLLVTLEMANISYIARFNTLRTEEKEQSASLARSCLQIALVRLAENPDYRPASTSDSSLGGPGPSGDNLKIDQDICQIISIDTSGPEELLVKTTATKGKSISNLLTSVHFTGSDISVNSIKEILDD